MRLHLIGQGWCEPDLRVFLDVGKVNAEFLLHRRPHPVDAGGRGATTERTLGIRLHIEQQPGARARVQTHEVDRPRGPELHRVDDPPMSHHPRGNHRLAIGASGVLIHAA